MINSQEKQPIISVIVPVKNEEQYIEKCLRAVLDQEYSSNLFEVVVVDNGSTDMTLEIINQVVEIYKAKNRISILKKEGGTIASVRNFGASHASGETLAFLDGDCEPDPAWLRTGVEILGRTPGAACVGFKDRPRGQGDPWVERAWHHISSTCGVTGNQFVPWLPTFNLMVLRSVFDEVGGFDEALETCEDADFGYRVGVKYKLLKSDQVAVYHMRDPKTLSEFFLKEFWRGRSNFQSFLSSSNKLHDFRSVFVPAWYLIVLFCAVSGLILSGFLNHSQHVFNTSMMLLLIAIVCPFFFALARGTGFKDFKTIAQTSLLVAIYLTARGMAVLKYKSKK